MSMFMLLMVLSFSLALFFSMQGMARIKLGPLVSDIRGTVNELAFSIWKSGVAYVRGKSGAIQNPQSSSQGLKRAVVALLSKRWRSVLSQVERDGWDTWALTQPGKGDNDGGINNMIKGNNGVMSGFNAHILANTWLASAGIGFKTIAPNAAPAPTPPTTVAVTFAGGIATVTWNTPGTAEAGAICRIWGRIEGIKGHVQLITTAAFDANTKDITSVRAAKGNNILLAALVGKTMHVQIDTVNPTGGKSAGSNVAQAVIA